MSGEGESAAAEPTPPTRTRVFRKAFTAVRPAPELVERQGRIARVAFERLGRDRATAFLNTHDDGLGGRPLDIALASDEGMKRIEAAILAQVAA